MTGREFPKRDRNSVLVYVAGVGKGPDGTPGGFAYCIEPTGKWCRRWDDDLIDAEADCEALLFAVENVPLEYDEAEILTDSRRLVREFRRACNTGKPEVRDPISQAVCKIRERRLSVALSWVPRHRNPARELIEE